MFGKKDDKYGKLITKIKGTVPDDEKVGFFEKWPHYVYFYDNGFRYIYDHEEMWIPLEKIEQMYCYEDVLVNAMSTRLVIAFYDDNGEQYTKKISEYYYENIVDIAFSVCDHENWKHLKPIEYPQTIKWITACTSMIFTFWTMNTTIFGEPFSKKPNQYRIRDLKKHWGITDKASMDKEFTNLYQGPYMMQLDRDPNSVNLDQKIKELKDGKDMDKIDEWTHDLYRLMMTCNNAVSAHICTEKEGLDWCLKAGLYLQQLHDNWDELHASYIRGYSKWSGDSVNNKESDVYKRNRIYEEMKKRPHSPWKIDFKTKLSKEW